MRDGDDRPRVDLQMVLEPGDRLCVEVVGRLVEQEQVGPLEQHLAERDAALLAAGERGDVGLARRAAQRVHCLLDGAIELPGVGRLDGILDLRLLVEQLLHLVAVGALAEAVVDLVEARQQRLGLLHALEDVVEDVLLRVEPWLLRQVADGDAVGGRGVTKEIGVLAGHDPQQRALAGSVAADDADLRAEEEAQRQVLEHLLVRWVHPAQALGREDVVAVAHGGVLRGRARLAAWGRAH